MSTIMGNIDNAKKNILDTLEYYAGELQDAMINIKLNQCDDAYETLKQLKYEIQKELDNE